MYAKANNIPFMVTAVPSTADVQINGTAGSISAYNIDGNNYFKLRDIAKVVDFGMTWNATTNTIMINTTTGYN